MTTKINDIRASRIQVDKEDEDTVWLTVWLQDREFGWHELKIAIDKDRFEEMQ